MSFPNNPPANIQDEKVLHASDLFALAHWSASSMASLNRTGLAPVGLFHPIDSNCDCNRFAATEERITVTNLAVLVAGCLAIELSAGVAVGSEMWVHWHANEDTGRLEIEVDGNKSNPWEESGGASLQLCVKTDNGALDIVAPVIAIFAERSCREAYARLKLSLGRFAAIVSDFAHADRASDELELGALGRAHLELTNINETGLNETPSALLSKINAFEFSLRRVSNHLGWLRAVEHNDMTRERMRQEVEPSSPKLPFLELNQNTYLSASNVKKMLQRFADLLESAKTPFVASNEIVGTLLHSGQTEVETVANVQVCVYEPNNFRAFYLVGITREIRLHMVKDEFATLNVTDIGKPHDLGATTRFWIAFPEGTIPPRVFGIRNTKTVTVTQNRHGLLGLRAAEQWAEISRISIELGVDLPKRTDLNNAEKRVEWILENGSKRAS